MKARDIMTRKVRTAAPTTSVRDLAQTMVARGISALPVVDRKGRILGIVSEGDLLRRAEAGTKGRRAWWRNLLAGTGSQAREYVKRRGTRARDVMTRPVVSVTETTDVAEIADLIEKWRIKRVPVVRRGKLVGIVSRRDLVRIVSRAKLAGRHAGPDDAALRDQLRRQLDSEPWSGAAFVNFVVEKGVIELHGMVGSPAQRDAVRVLAENTPGAREVKDKLSILPYPVTGV
jgi:CBS domain-containing protein